MMLCTVIRFVGRTGVPVDDELALADTIADPMVAHVHGFGATLFDIIIGDAARDAAVSFKRCRWLLPTEFLEGSALGNGLFAVVVETSVFDFSSGGNDLLEDLRGVE